MNPAEMVAAEPLFKKAGLRETTVLLGVAWLVPFVVHLVPWSGERPLGVYLLPMFWATFVAAYFYGARIGLLVGLFSPAINLLVTGLPAWRFHGEMAVELAIFALVTAWAVRRLGRFALIAPLGYVGAKMVTMVLLAPTAPAMDLARSLVSALAGLAALAAINAALVWFYPKSPGGER